MMSSPCDFFTIEAEVQRVLYVKHTYLNGFRFCNFVDWRLFFSVAPKGAHPFLVQFGLRSMVDTEAWLIFCK